MESTAALWNHVNVDFATRIGQLGYRRAAFGRSTSAVPRGTALRGDDDGYAGGHQFN